MPKRGAHDWGRAHDIFIPSMRVSSARGPRSDTARTAMPLTNIPSGHMRRPRHTTPGREKATTALTTAADAEQHTVWSPQRPTMSVLLAKSVCTSNPHT